MDTNDIGRARNFTDEILGLADRLPNMSMEMFGHVLTEVKRAWREGFESGRDSAYIGRFDQYDTGSLMFDSAIEPYSGEVIPSEHMRVKRTLKPPKPTAFATGQWVVVDQMRRERVGQIVKTKPHEPNLYIVRLWLEDEKRHVKGQGTVFHYDYIHLADELTLNRHRVPKESR